MLDAVNEDSSELVKVVGREDVINPSAFDERVYICDYLEKGERAWWMRKEFYFYRGATAEWTEQGVKVSDDYSIILSSEELSLTFTCRCLEWTCAGSAKTLRVWI